MGLVRASPGRWYVVFMGRLQKFRAINYTHELGSWNLIGISGVLHALESYLPPVVDVTDKKKFNAQIMAEN